MPFTKQEAKTGDVVSIPGHVVALAIAVVGVVGPFMPFDLIPQ